jgi:hypothetical protein
MEADASFTTVRNVSLRLRAFEPRTFQTKIL